MLYGTLLEADTMRARKREVFARLVRELRALDQRFGTESSLAAALDGKPNNARLASSCNLLRVRPRLRAPAADSGHDLPRFYAAVRSLAKLPREERRARLCRPEAQSRP
jgi:predicted aminopeptidase